MSIHRLGQLAREWHELEESGTPLEPPAYRVGFSRNGGLTVRQEPAPYERGIRELSSGRIAYVLPAFIRRNDPGKTIIRDVTLAVPWDDSIEWLEEDTKRNPGWYTFSEDRNPPKHEYPRGMVLNHKMACTLSRGDIREGFLLAVGKVRPPETYHTGDRIAVTLRLVDQWDCEPSGIFKLQLQRCRNFGDKIKKSRRGPLLSRRDKIVQGSPIAAPLKVQSQDDEERSQRMVDRLIHRCKRTQSAHEKVMD